VPFVRETSEPDLVGEQRGVLLPRASQPVPLAAGNGSPARIDAGLERDAAARASDVASAAGWAGGQRRGAAGGFPRNPGPCTQSPAEDEGNGGAAQRGNS